MTLTKQQAKEQDSGTHTQFASFHLVQVLVLRPWIAHLFAWESVKAAAAHERDQVQPILSALLLLITTLLLPCVAPDFTAVLQ